MRTALRILVYGSLDVVAVVLVLLLLPVRLVRRALSRGRSPRSLWTGAPVINMAINARAERRLGVRAESVVSETYFTTSAFDRNWSRAARVPVLGKVVPHLLFVWACVVADRLHFYCDRGFLLPWRPFTFRRLELVAYRLLRVPVFFWTYGADVRSRAATEALGDPNCCTDCTRVGEACICDEERRRRNMNRLAHHGRAFFGMGDMMEYAPAERDGFTVRHDLFFWPVDLADDRYRPVYPALTGDRLRIVHAPNHRMFKGTRFLIDAVAQLEAEGVPVELILVERVPNDEALEIYRTADVIFDQCLVGFHGFFAIEGLAMGKPVMCFIRKPEAYLLEPDACPIVRTHVDRLADDLRRLASDRGQLSAIGRAGRAYVERHMTVEAFAQRLRRAYSDLGI